MRITLKALEGLTYVCTDALLLEDINKKLDGVMADMRSTLPAADGLVIRPAIKERIKQSEIRTARGYSSLPQYNKREGNEMTTNTETVWAREQSSLER